MPFEMRFELEVVPFMFLSATKVTIDFSVLQNEPHRKGTIAGRVAIISQRDLIRSEVGFYALQAVKTW